MRLQALSLLVCLLGRTAESRPKPRNGAAPEGVSPEAALASAKVLQPELFEALPLEFLPDMVNPCWLLAEDEKDTLLDERRAAAPLAGCGRSACWLLRPPPYRYTGQAARLRCLPYYYLLGDFNCGVRDLHTRMLRHPQVVSAINSAPHWWDENKAWKSYWPLFKSAGVKISEASSRDMVVGDGSFATFAFMWAGNGRSMWPWGKAMQACRESCKQEGSCISDSCYAEAQEKWHPIRGDGSQLSTPWLMRLAMGTNIKLVVMLRDPVERLHAAFWGGHHYHHRYGANESGFAAFALQSLADFRECLDGGHTAEECVLAFEAWSATQEQVYYHDDQLTKSVYSVFLKQWLAAFPREDVLVLRLEDYAQDGGVARALKAVFRHLGLTEEVPPEAWRQMLEAPITRGSHPREGATCCPTPLRAPPEGIDPAVRATLQAFFAPFGQELETLLGEPGFADWHSGHSFLP